MRVLCRIISVSVVLALSSWTDASSWNRRRRIRPPPLELTIPDAPEEADTTTTENLAPPARQQRRRPPGVLEEEEESPPPPPLAVADDEERTSNQQVAVNPLLQEDPTRLFDTEISTVPELPSWGAAPPVVDDNNVPPPNATKGDTSQQQQQRLRPSQLSFPRRNGEIDVGIPGAGFSRPVDHNNALMIPRHQRQRRNRNSPHQQHNLELSIDPFSGLRLLQVAVAASSSVGAAVWGTLRVLAPLVVAARSYRRLCDVTRQHVLRHEQQKKLLLLDSQKGAGGSSSSSSHIKQPLRSPTTRSLARWCVHYGVLVVVGSVVQYVLGMSQYPCLLESSSSSATSSSSGGGGGCRWICGVLWLVPVLGVGHAVSTALALWGGPYLELQMMRKSPRRRRRLVEWLQDPDEWIRAAANQNYNSNNRQFFSSAASASLVQVFSGFLQYPSGGIEPAWLLMMVAVTKEMTSGAGTMKAMMVLVSLQQVFRDEWLRVLLVEKRIDLGLVSAAGYVVTTVGMLWTAMRKPAMRVSSLSIILLLPSVFSVLVTAWMNIVLYLDHKEIKRQQAAAAEAEAAAFAPKATPNVPGLLQP